jgi:hypothetical protein
MQKPAQLNWTNPQLADVAHYVLDAGVILEAIVR